MRRNWHIKTPLASSAACPLPRQFQAVHRYIHFLLIAVARQQRRFCAHMNLNRLIREKARVKLDFLASS
ncbi:hypothetical protein O9992_05355 [Vibrio lentus]|nr:hypothetical protein [Vibrio lentus]